MNKVGFARVLARQFLRLALATICSTAKINKAPAALPTFAKTAARFIVSALYVRHSAARNSRILRPFPLHSSVWPTFICSPHVDLAMRSSRRLDVMQQLKRALFVGATGCYSNVNTRNKKTRGRGPARELVICTGRRNNLAPACS